MGNVPEQLLAAVEILPLEPLMAASTSLGPSSSISTLVIVVQWALTTRDISRKAEKIAARVANFAIVCHKRVMIVSDSEKSVYLIHGFVAVASERGGGC